MKGVEQSVSSVQDPFGVSSRLSLVDQPRLIFSARALTFFLPLHNWGVRNRRKCTSPVQYLKLPQVSGRSRSIAAAICITGADALLPFYCVPLKRDTRQKVNVKATGGNPFSLFHLFRYRRKIKQKGVLPKDEKNLCVGLPHFTSTRWSGYQGPFWQIHRKECPVSPFPARFLVSYGINQVEV